MSRFYTKEEKQALIAPFAWYHKIDLGDGVITPGYDYDLLWSTIRKTREHLDYRHMHVLDIGSFDGMWAFEAEQLGANSVIATDAVPVSGKGSGNAPWQALYEKVLMVRDILGSKVMPYYNVAPHELVERLDTVVHRRLDGDQQKFDIIQHLGVLYHLRNPMLSLAQARKLIKDNGFLMIETEIIWNEERSIMEFNGDDSQNLRFTTDRTSWWCPSLPCLMEMLRTNFFEPLPETLESFELKYQPGYGRAALIARAQPLESADPMLRNEMNLHCRNPDHIP